MLCYTLILAPGTPALRTPVFLTLYYVFILFTLYFILNITPRKANTLHLTGINKLTFRISANFKKKGKRQREKVIYSLIYDSLLMRLNREFYKVLQIHLIKVFCLLLLLIPKRHRFSASIWILSFPLEQF